MNDLLDKFRSDPDWHQVMEWAAKNRPPTVFYRPASTDDEENYQVRNWKAQCQKQDGFDLLYQILTGRKPI